MSPIPSGDQSPARQRSNSSASVTEISSSVQVSALVRDQPFPLWADLYSVIFGTRGEFYAVGRIKASCSLQVNFFLDEIWGCPFKVSMKKLRESLTFC
ncbi:hypothetical protein ACTXT7_017360 [Hymenolepis weldensis]